MRSTLDFTFRKKKLTGLLICRPVYRSDFRRTNLMQVTTSLSHLNLLS